MSGGEAFARLLEACAKAEGEARSHFIGALALLAKEIERTAEAAARGEFVDAAGPFQQPVAEHAGEGFAQVGDVLIELGARLNDELGGGGRRGSANVGDEIGDGEIGFVADAGDHGNFRSEDGARDDFFVEGPQILHGAAAAREDEHVHDSSGVEKFQGFDDFLGGAFALHAHGINSQMYVRETPRENTHDVAHSGAARRRDNADAAGKKRQRLLARRVEKAFGFEAFLQLLERELERAETNGLQIFHVNLILAARFVDAEGTAHGHLQAVFGTELDAALLLFEKDAADLRAIVFQCEVDMAGLRFAAVGDFTLHGDVGEVFGEEVPDLGGEFADGPGPFLRDEIESELGHRKWLATGEL